MPKQADILHLLITWGVLAFVILIFALIVHSASAYQRRKRFWLVLLLTIGVTYVLSALLTFLFHLDTILVVMIALIVAFVIQGDVGIHANDVASSEEPEDYYEETIVETDEPEEVFGQNINVPVNDFR